MLVANKQLKGRKKKRRTRRWKVSQCYGVLMVVHTHEQERIMTSFLFGREEEERVTSYSGRGESRIFRVYYK